MDDDKDRTIGLRIHSDPDVTGIEQPQTGRARRAVDLPLRLLVVSDLAPHRDVSDWSAFSGIRRVDKQSFSEYIAEVVPKLAIEVPNKISESPAALDVELQFRSLKDFHPEQVVRQVPALAQLLDIRHLVETVADRELDAASFQHQLEKIGVDAGWARELHALISAPESAQKKPPAQPRSTSDAEPEDALDRLFGMVDTGGSQEAPERTETPPSRGLVGSLMDAAAGSSESQVGGRVEKSAAAALVKQLDDVVAEQLNAILNHPAFRRLEGAWRGLKFLVDRIDFRSNIQFDVLPVRRDDLSEAVYHQILLPEHAGKNGPVPLTAIVLDFAFDRSQAEIALLDDLAETGASLQVPVIAAAAPSFFGIAEPSGLNRLPPLSQHLDGPEYIAWNKLRLNQHSQMLALVPVPFLLRTAYGTSNPAGAFGLEETGQAWGNGSLLIAAMIAQSFARTGWPTHLLRNGSPGLDALPLWKTGGAMIPLAAALSGDRQAELAAAGFVVPACKLNDDAVTIEHEPMVHRPSPGEDPMTLNDWSHAPLSGRLFAARVAQFVLALQEELDGARSAEELKSEIERAMHSFLGTNPGDADAVSVRHVDGAAPSEAKVFVAGIQPPPEILRERIRLGVSLKIARMEV